MKNFKFLLIWTAILLAAFIGLTLHSAAAFVMLLALFSLANARPTACLRVTLSVPELSQITIEAFKTRTPELFEPGGFALNVSSDTAVLGDTITARITSVPAAQDYDPTPGVGFAKNIADATDILQDVPITLAYFKHVPIRIKWLSQLSSKINLSVALMEQGFSLRKYVIDTCLQQILPGYFSYQKYIDPANVTLDAIEGLRGKMNTQKCSDTGRFLICNSPFSEVLQSDQRIGSKLFYGQLSGAEGYRRWRNLAGFSNVYEYPEFPAGDNLEAFAADRRAIIVAVRPLDFAKVTPESLGIPRILSETRMIDPETKMPFVGIGWQDPGTGDLYTSIGILFGVAAGSQGGGQDSATDRAGVRVVTQGPDI